MAVLGVLSLAGPAAVAATPAGAAPLPTTRLVGSAAPLPTGAAVVGPVDPAEQVTADVVLRPQDPAALQRVAASVADPRSPDYRHYLTTSQFRQDFGPSPQSTAAVRDWLAAAGLTLGATSANGMLVPVSGPAARVQQAFDTTLVRTRLPDGRLARAPSAPPAVPAGLAPAVTGVVGLSTVPLARPELATATTGGHPADGAASAAGPSPRAGPVACGAAASAATFFNGWTADSLASAYGLSSLYGAGRVGAGQQVGIFELAPYSPSDVTTYQACFGTTASVTNVPVDGGAGFGSELEPDLDIEVVAGLAPSSDISVFSGPNAGSGPIDTYARMVDDPAIRVLSTSWGLCEPEMTPAVQQTETALFQQAVLQGQTVLAASGDSGSSDCYNPSNGDNNKQIAVDDPADQPDVTGVGGTTLSAFGSDAPTESVWNSGSMATGGGNSTDFAAASWQQIPAAQNPFTASNCGTGGTSQCREVPDVAATADPDRGDIVFVGGGWVPVGGTSAAAPLWAALTADVNQGCAASAGFLNSQLYPAGAGGSPPFHDVASGSTNNIGAPPLNHYPVTPGYDLTTGWGSPDAPALLGVLSGSTSGCPSVTGLSPNAGPAFGGTTVVISGSGFGSAVPSVRFGSVPAQVQAHTPTSITVTAPNVGAGGTLGVTVTTVGPGGGTSPVVPGSIYTYLSPHVTSVVPFRGPVTGGGQVTVRGSDFNGVTSVTFGGAPAAFQVSSPTSLVARVPPGPSGGGSVDVVVTNSEGFSPSVAGDRYSYLLPGYWLVASDGGIFSFGGSGFFGSTGALTLNKPVVGMAATPDGGGYWLVASDGGIFSYGDAGFFGSTGALHLNRPVVGMAATPDGGGYWLVASDGGIFSYGDAGFFGSTGAIPLNQPVVGMAATPDGGGYWLVAADGGIFSYGDAAFFGSTGALHLNRPVVGMAAAPDGGGYWLVASDGGIFSYGNAGFFGSTGAIPLNQPVVGLAASLTGLGYWLVASDGGIFSYGDAGFFGSTGAIHLNRPVVGMAGI
jgi:hypothetical protein